MLNFGMPAGFEAALAQKYNIMQQEANANAAEAKSRANLTDVNAGLAPELAKASEAASYGGAKANIAQAGLFGSQTTAEDQLNALVGNGGLVSNPIIQSLLSKLGGGGLPSGSTVTAPAYTAPKAAAAPAGTGLGLRATTPSVRVVRGNIEGF